MPDADAADLPPVRGLLADENLGGQLLELRRRIAERKLAEVIEFYGFEVEPFAALGLPTGTEDRTVWRRCQAAGWVLWTDNRNDDGPDSLAAALREEWRPGVRPVLTLGSEPRFDRDVGYRNRVAEAVVQLLVDLAEATVPPAEPRAFVPRSA